MARKTPKKGSGSRQEEFDFEERVQEVPFHTATRRRYLNYAISVITARALPDVRDGLKPVQRRILYTMQNDLHLSPSQKPKKCARIVGDVLGKYHPHGDSAVYEALVRMAQDFSLRYPLVDGHGNFGSLDGDGAAAYRYTEARLQPVAMQLLQELGQETVDFRLNYDGKTREPTVLPARVPQLLVNGASGIAVGMATNVPPHNLSEVLAGCLALITKRSLGVADLLKHIKGPDFPTGGEVLTTRADLERIYTEGHGSVRLRGEYKLETTSGKGRGKEKDVVQIIVTSIPYQVQKDALVRSIGELIYQRKVPQLTDVRDESTTDVRIVLEMKSGSDTERVMGYLYKHTQLQTNFSLNLTCLVPTDNPEVCAPARIDLKSMLVHFIDFRFQVVERRFLHELKLLKARIHILEGFRKIFDALDEAIRIIRQSDGRADAAEKLKKRFKLDDIQANAILDMRLYKIAKLEIKAVLEELREKKKRVKEIEAILARPTRIWTVVKRELNEVGKEFGDSRRSRIRTRVTAEPEFDEQDFIVDEDAYIILSRDGWLKRVGRITDISKVRLRAEDGLLAALGGNTRHRVTFLSNLGSAYTLRINDIPASRGYGEPIQKFFKFRDGERVVAAYSFDPRVLPGAGRAPRSNGKPPQVHALAVSSSGYALRFSLDPFAEASTRSGRKFARLKPGEEIVGVYTIRGTENAVVATQSGRVLLFPVREVNFLSGAGRGVLGIKLSGKDRVLGVAVSREKKEGLRVYTTGGRKIDVTPRAYRVASRGGKGTEVIKRGGLSRVEAPPIELPDLGDGS